MKDNLTIFGGCLTVIILIILSSVLGFLEVGFADGYLSSSLEARLPIGESAA